MIGTARAALAAVVATGLAGPASVGAEDSRVPQASTPAAMRLSAGALGIVSYDTARDFDEVVFALENALMGQGLSVEGQGHSAPRLTDPDAAAGRASAFRHAEIFSFCSPELARRLVAADPLNLAYCPLSISVSVRHDRPEITTLGYRALPPALSEVAAMLDRVARMATGSPPLTTALRPQP